MKKYKNLECVLLIDDDEATNFYNQSIIEELDIDVEIEVAYSGQEGLDFLTKKTDDYGSLKFPKPGIIFLDVNMPGMNGWEFLDKYQMLPEEQKAMLIVTMLTTSTNPDDKAKAKKYDYVGGFLSKPLKTIDVQNIIDKNFELIE